MPLVQVSWWKGAGTDQRRQLVEEVTETVARIAKCPEAAVTVIVNDVETDHWGRGGTLASEL
ncbi:tautomerase family protein [Streptomyces varsoviensis]|uniref:Tautomerase n=1 Tax=Streptomyces varsoviensis TaxID=67373 RepID=A0ABR5JBN1_9ACTN|nr:4-oxalocrotonate tautomerase family protein [Streptomyces varsoviensis]KOG90800.1 4-oxalocrotonate tautomerase family enzyme [Streptomyces varsoviensis]